MRYQVSEVPNGPLASTAMTSDNLVENVIG